MGKINVLSFAVANLIAAGEVVDRPASVIKELLENAIDSGADHITVEIQNGGVTYMRVSDNGCGMASDDLPIAIRRHATSKIKDAKDLDGILTLGFRGEALAAIASVSDLRIISKTHDAPIGAVLEAHGGVVVGVTERACSDGTSVVVENLFANVPARRKFLKKDVTEAMAVSALVEKIALSKPHIAFRLISDGAVRMETVGDGDLKNAVYSVFGREFASKLIPAEFALNGVEVRGLIGRSDNVRANRNYQNFFINGRYVKSRTAMAALEQAYTSYIPSEKFPCCVLFLTIHPAAVDVNVHPAKLEVKFSNEKPVFEAVYYAVRNAMEANQARPDLALPTASGRQGRMEARLSDSLTPIEEGRSESLKKRQLTADLSLPRVHGATVASEREEGRTDGGAKPSGGFAHMTASEYVRQYLKTEEKVEAAFPPLPRKDTVSGGASSATRQNAASVDIPVEPAPREAVLPPLEEMPCEEAADMRPSFAEHQPPCAEAEPMSSRREPTGMPERSEPVPSNAPCEASSEAPRTLAYRILGEAFHAYVLVEMEEKLLLIDKHAAHERILFEELKAGMRDRNKASQLLMVPIEVMVTSDEIETLVQFREEIEAVGFAFTVGRYAVSVTEMPEGISTDAVADMLTVIAERLKEQTGSARLTRDTVFEKALYQASCKAAIKAGREYSDGHIEWLVAKLMALPDITVCPHGRPVAMELTKKNLDHQFERS